MEVPDPQAQSRFLLTLMMMQSDMGLFFLHLCTCKHLLDLLELTGTLVLVVAGPRVDDYHGHGGLPRPDRPHGLGSLSSQDLRFLYRCKLHVHVGLGIGEGGGSVELLAVGGECVDGDELLVVFCEGVSGDKLLGAGNQNWVGIAMMIGYVVVVSTDLAFSVVLAASQLVSSLCSSLPSFL